MGETEQRTAIIMTLTPFPPSVYKYNCKTNLDFLLAALLSNVLRACLVSRQVLVRFVDIRVALTVTALTYTVSL